MQITSLKPFSLHLGYRKFINVANYARDLVSITKRYPKDIANMSYTVYHPKEKQIEKEKQEQ